ncbi:MAG: hypothetical protein KC657_35285 [Myxococcales bacterium]|nr:hypothetical protein [Myxococcales bacterium]
MSDKRPDHLLDDELCWAEGGHASDIALTAIADGELSIVPSEVRAHVDTCLTCSGHVGNAALLSLHAGERLADLAPADRLTAPERRPVPVMAIVVGLAVAFAGALPTLLDAMRSPGELGRAIPILGRGAALLGRRLLDPGGTAGLVLVWGAALLLIGVAIGIMRLAPRKEEVSS